jgi:hypothetical protein
MKPRTFLSAASTFEISTRAPSSSPPGALPQAVPIKIGSHAAPKIGYRGSADEEDPDMLRPLTCQNLGGAEGI